MLVRAVNERVFIDPSSASRIRTNGGMYVCGEAPGNCLQIFHNPRTGPIYICAIFENYEHIRVVEHGLCAHGFHLRRGQQGGNDRVRDLVFYVVGWLALPIGMNDHLHIGNVRQGVQRNMAQGPNPSQREQQHAGKDQESIVCAPLDDSGDHGYIPPVALTVNCLLTIVCPLCWARMVTCQVPPEPRSPLPSYVPPPLSVAFMSVFIAAIPIAGMAAI